jgi:hypothetical protein
MDTFFAKPISSVYSPSFSSPTILTPISSPVLTSVAIGPTVSNVLIGPPSLSIYPPYRSSYPYVTTYAPPTGAYYYDSGIGENSLAQHETTTDLRYRFLDKYLWTSDEILKMLKVSEAGVVTVLSKDKAESNDISKDSEQIITKKADYIGDEILTIGKAYKVLMNVCYKYNIKFYDLPHNEHLCMKAFAKYVKEKLQEQ